MSLSHKDVDKPGSLHLYVAGFIISVVLTVAAYLAVVQQLAEGWLLLGVIVICALIQLYVQLVFFLHLGHESKPKWNVATFLFMLLVLLILVFGSIWIMNNLNYNTMSPDETDTYLIDKEGIKR